VANLGPGKKPWFDGHQEMEQALVRFGRFVNDMEGNGRGDSYIKLAAGKPAKALAAITPWAIMLTVKPAQAAA